MPQLNPGTLTVNKSLKIGGPVPGLGRAETGFKLQRGYQALSIVLGVLTDAEAEQPLLPHAERMLNSLGWVNPATLDNAALVGAALNLVHALCPTGAAIPDQYHARQELLALRRALGLDGHNAEANPQ